MIELMLDLDAVRPSLPAGWRVEWHQRVGSTNDLARDAAVAGVEEGLVVGAETQSAGRGRQGRRWEDRRGQDLLFSLLLRPTDEAVAARLGLVAAAACITGLSRWCDDVLGLRWPNDLVVGGGKIAGVLVEQAGSAYVVGIGINVLGQAPRLSDGRLAQTVQQVAQRHGLAPPAREDVLVAVLADLHRLYGLVSDGDARELMRIVADRDILRGRPVAVRQTGRTLRGVAVGINAEGRLGLDLTGGNGRLWLASGEVIAVE